MSPATHTFPREEKTPLCTERCRSRAPVRRPFAGMCASYYYESQVYCSNFKVVRYYIGGMQKCVECANPDLFGQVWSRT